MLFYSHDGTGLGHLRITLGVAGALAAAEPEASVLLLTGSLQASAYGMPPNLDYVKLPAMPLRALYEGLPDPASPPGTHRHVMYIREMLALATMQAFAPDLVVVDHAPAGLFQELARAIAWLKASLPESRLALLMRDITFGPEQTRTIWTNEGVYPLLDHAYDRILVYGDRDLFDPVAEYGVSEAAAAKTRFCGYLTPAPPERSPERVRRELDAEGRRLLAVSVGGGADGGPVLRALLQGWRDLAPEGLAGYVVLGPLLPEEDRAEARALAAGLPGVTLADFDPDYLAVARAADALVSMAGYNSMCEAAFVGTRAVVVPRLPGPEEQVIRADRFARHGLVTVVDPRELSPATLWEAIRVELDRGSDHLHAPAFALPFGAERAIVDELRALLPANPVTSA